MNIPLPPKYKRLIHPETERELINKEMITYYDTIVFEWRDPILCMEEAPFLNFLINEQDQHIFTPLYFKCFRFRIEGFFKTQIKQWMFTIDKKEISFSKFVNLTLSCNHFCKICHTLPDLFGKQSLQILEKEEPPQLFSILLFYLNLNLICKIMNVNTLQERDLQIKENKKININRIMWDKNCIAIPKNIYNLSHPFTNEFIIEFVNVELDVEFIYYSEDLSLFEKNLEMLNLITIILTKEDDFFKYRPQGFAIWRYVLSLYIYRKFTILNEEESIDFVQNLSKNLVWNKEITEKIMFILSMVNSNGKLQNLFCVEEMFIILSKYYQITPILDVLYYLFRQSNHTIADFSLLQIDDSFEIAQKKTEIFFSIQELTQRYSIFQLLTFTQEITFVNLYTNSFALTYLFVSSIKNQSFHTIVESLNGKDMKNMNLEQPKFIFQEISNDVDILPLFYEIFIEVYNNQENLYAMLFHYFANQISSKIKSIENIEWLCRLNPNTPHFKQILINCVENSKLFYKKNETSFDKNEYDVKNIYIIDLTSKDRPSKFTIYE